MTIVSSVKQVGNRNPLSVPLQAARRRRLQRQRTGALGEAQHAQQHGAPAADRPAQRLRGPAHPGAGGQRQGEGGQGGDTEGGGPVLRPPGGGLGGDGAPEGRAAAAAGEAEGEGVAAEAEPGREAVGRWGCAKRVCVLRSEKRDLPYRQRSAVGGR